MAELKEYITQLISIDSVNLDLFLSKFEQRLVKKDEFVLRQGQVCREYFFIRSGALRIYFDNNDKQITGWIALEGDFFTELSSLSTQQPSRFNIRSISDTDLLFISGTTMNMLYTQFPEWQEFGRKIWETAFLKVIDGILSFQTMTAEERYLDMMNKTDLLQNVSLKDLSSYLGITQSSLSRLRKNIK